MERSADRHQLTFVDVSLECGSGVIGLSPPGRSECPNTSVDGRQLPNPIDQHSTAAKDIQRTYTPTTKNDNLSIPSPFGITVYSSIADLCASPSPHPALWNESITHFIDGVPSPLRPGAWRRILLDQEIPDPDALFLLDGVTNGFKLVDPGADIDDYITENYYSASVTSKDKVDDIIQHEISQGKFSITDSKPQCVHALGAVQKSSGGIRNITDCSRPKGYSVNNYMKETFSYFVTNPWMMLWPSCSLVCLWQSPISLAPIELFPSGLQIGHFRA